MKEKMKKSLQNKQKEKPTISIEKRYERAKIKKVQVSDCKLQTGKIQQLAPAETRSSPCHQKVLRWHKNE